MLLTSQGKYLSVNSDSRVFLGLFPPESALGKCWLNELASSERGREREGGRGRGRKGELSKQERVSVNLCLKGWVHVGAEGLPATVEDREMSGENQRPYRNSVFWFGLFDSMTFEK